VPVLQSAQSGDGLTSIGGVVQVKSRSGARRVYLRLLVAVPLALGAMPVAAASAAILMEAFPEGPMTSEQHELGGLGEMSVTPSYKFTVATLPPVVTLEQPTSPSNNTAPSFSGTASETTPVTVTVFKGESAEGTAIATLKVQGTGGSWVSARVSPPLPDGTYTAVATQPSSLGYPTGASGPVTFEVDTQSPTVTMEAPPSPSNDMTPSFSGTASEATPVTVEIFEGARPEGNILTTVTAQGTGGSWTSGPLTPPLPSGRHTFTAVATQTSKIKNAPGKSAPITFVVNTEPPVVTLKAPPSPSNDTTPSFSGTASEATQVTVEIFEGMAAEGKIVAMATATGTGGGWTSSEATPALASGTFTALAAQPSGIGNPEGRSIPVTFTVDSSPPTVTLNPLPSPSGNAAPSFSGTASDQTPVAVDVYKGAKTEGPVVAAATAEIDGGEWVSNRASPALGWGEYTAVATQPSSVGNPRGASSPLTFAVEPIAPTVATEAPSEVTRTSAALYASVDPAGAAVSACDFEYGTTFSYGTSIECGFVSGINAFPPDGIAAVPVFARIYGLSPATTYHFRVVAIGEGGNGDGTDETFTTLPPWIFNEASASRGRPSPPSAPASARGVAAGGIAGLIARQLTPHGQAARIAALLRTGVFKVRFKAPEAGMTVVRWYYVPPVELTGGTGPPVLIASGHLRVRTAGTALLTVRLTGAGIRALRAARRMRLTATFVFTPVGAASERTSRTFELRP
jgi:hypothetical protein